MDRRSGQSPKANFASGEDVASSCTDLTCARTETSRCQEDTRFKSGHVNEEDGSAIRQRGLQFGDPNPASLPILLRLGASTPGGSSRALSLPQAAMRGAHIHHGNSSWGGNTGGSASTICDRKRSGTTDDDHESRSQPRLFQLFEPTSPHLF